MCGYIIAPLGLSERQMLIYHCLYKKCNFDDMSVRVTTSQIIADIKIIDLSVKVVNSEVKKMIEKGYLKVRKKGNKGNCSVYEIVKMNELESGNLTATNRQVKGNLKTSNSNTSTDEVETDRQLNGNLKAIPIKEKEKEKNIYIDEVWSLYPKKQGKAAAIKKIPKIINDIGKDKLIECIGNYIEYVEDTRKNSFNLEYMNGSTFFNGRYLDFMEKQKGPTAIGPGNKKTNYNPSICNNNNNYTNKQKIDVINNFI